MYLFVCQLALHFQESYNIFLLVSISLTRNIQLDFVCLLFCAPLSRNIQQVFVCFLVNASLSRNIHHVFVCLLVSVLFDYAQYPCFHFTTPFHFSFNYYVHQLHILIFVLVMIHLLSISFYLYIYLNIHSFVLLHLYPTASKSKCYPLLLSFTLTNYLLLQSINYNRFIYFNGVVTNVP